MALHPPRLAVLFQQHHCGVYRSDDRGDTWVDISDGLITSVHQEFNLHLIFC